MRGIDNRLMNIHKQTNRIAKNESIIAHNTEVLN